MSSDKNNYNSSYQIRHLGTGENGGNQENIVSSTNSYVSTPENKNRTLKRKNTNESDSLYKKTCFDDFGSGTIGKQMYNGDYNIVATMEFQNPALMANNSFGNYLQEQEIFYKDVIQEAKSQQNSEESSSQGLIYSDLFHDTITKSGENFYFPTSKATETNIDENTKVNDFHGNVLDEDNQRNHVESGDSGHNMKFLKPFFATHERENSPSYNKLHPTSIFSELPNETSNNPNETNNTIINKTEDFVEERNVIEVLRDVDSRKTDIEFLILPSTSACQCIENNESFTIPIENIISIDEAKQFAGAEIKLENKVIIASSINLGASGERRINDTEEQTSLPTKSIISTDSGALCDQVEEPMILDENTNPPLRTHTKYTCCLLNRDYLENSKRSRECININNLVDNHEKNDRNNLIEYEIERLQNDNSKTLIDDTLQLSEFKTGFESGDMIMPNRLNSENNIAPTAITQEAIAQLPNTFNITSFGSTENSRLDRKEFQGSNFTNAIGKEPTITNAKCSLSNISDAESCLDQVIERPKVIQNFRNMQSSVGVVRKSTKEPEKCIINKLILEFFKNRKNEEFAVQDIVQFVIQHTTSLSFIAVVQAIRISLEDYTKTGILKFKTNGKYKIEWDGTGDPFAASSKK